MQFAIRLMIIFGIIFCWALCQVDFVMAYPRAPIEIDIYMELPQGIQTAHGNSKDHVLKLEKNIYGQKQAGRAWNSFLVDKLMSLWFTPSLIDDCIFSRNDIIFMVYVDDGIFLGNNDSNFKMLSRKSRSRAKQRGSRSPSWLRWCQHQKTTRWFLWIHPTRPNWCNGVDLRMQRRQVCPCESVPTAARI